MADYLCIAVTFLDPRFHGRGDGGEPEWPPSPLRLMQAIVAANADLLGADGDLEGALKWLESQEAPLIVAPAHEIGRPYCLSVPNNAMDLVAKAWSKGNYHGSGDSNPATHRAMKTVCPIRMTGGDTVRYLWKLNEESPDVSSRITALAKAAGRIVALGWGIDLVVGQAARIDASQFREMSGQRWLPVLPTVPNSRRTPVRGTLAALQDRYNAFLHRLGKSGFTPVEPLAQFNMTGYRRPTDPVARPWAVFELQHDDGSFCRYPQRKLMHIAGMVRHLAKEAMQQSPPPDVDDTWVEQYVVGHRDNGNDEHSQFSYLPLPSIGHSHADHTVRRVMISASPGDDAWLEYLAGRLAGLQLKPERGDEFGESGPPTLVRAYYDSVVRRYTDPANRWASVTPVILPGHNDHKPAKTRKLIDAALTQSGIEQPCTYEWGPFSRFRKALSAHKYDRNKRPICLRPDHLKTFTAVHLVLTFDDELEPPGPLVIGAGRHCGFGLMAGAFDDNNARD